MISENHLAICLTSHISRATRKLVCNPCMKCSMLTMKSYKLNYPKPYKFHSYTINMYQLNTHKSWDPDLSGYCFLSVKQYCFHSNKHGTLQFPHSGSEYVYTLLIRAMV